MTRISESRTARAHRKWTNELRKLEVAADRRVETLNRTAGRRAIEIGNVHSLGSLEAEAAATKERETALPEIRDLEDQALTAAESLNNVAHRYLDHLTRGTNVDLGTADMQRAAAAKPFADADAAWRPLADVVNGLESAIDADDAGLVFARLHALRERTTTPPREGEARAGDADPEVRSRAQRALADAEAFLRRGQDMAGIRNTLDRSIKRAADIRQAIDDARRNRGEGHRYRPSDVVRFPDDVDSELSEPNQYQRVFGYRESVA